MVFGARGLMLLVSFVYKVFSQCKKRGYFRLSSAQSRYWLLSGFYAGLWEKSGKFSDASKDHGGGKGGCLMCSKQGL